MQSDPKQDNPADMPAPGGEKSRMKRQPPRPRVTLALAASLAFALVAAWSVYMVLAPDPIQLPPRPSASSPAAAPEPGDDNQMRLLAWANAMDPQVLIDFQAETGLTVTVDTFTSNEQLAEIAASGALTHDLVLASGVGLSRLAVAHALRPMPVARLANYANLDPSLLARADAYDAGNVHSVPLLWGTTGLAFNTAMITERLGRDADTDTWALLFDPAQAAKLADCGIQVIDSPTRAFPIALGYLKRSPDSADPGDTEAAARLWETARPHIARFGADDLIPALASGRACLAVATSGDVYQARAMARASSSNVDISFVLPREGTVMWFDLLAMPAASRTTANAMKLIDYLLRPDVAARITNSRGFANAIPRAQLFVRPEIKSDPMLFPGPDVLARLTPEADPPPAIIGLRARFWRLINAPATPTAAPNGGRR